MGDRGFATDLRMAWEQRAQESGTSPVGVLPRNFPPLLNEYLHQQHVRIVREQLLSRLPAQARLLDLACGYGRMSTAISDVRPDIELVGLDFALSFCRAYRDDIGQPVVCGDVLTLPFVEGTFDAVLGLTALMYVPEPQLLSFVEHLFCMLKPGGVALFIEPGQEYLSVVQRIRGGSGTTVTSGRGLTIGEFKNLAQGINRQEVAHGGVPAFSLLLPVLYVLGRHENVLRPLLELLSVLDRKIETWSQFSFHRWIRIQKAD